MSLPIDSQRIGLQSLEWIVQHCVINQNNTLLNAIFTDINYEDTPFSHKTKILVTIAQILKLIGTNAQLNQKTENIFRLYHSLYPPILKKQHKIDSLSSPQKVELASFVKSLFENEIELKVQLILSAKYWQNDYIQHKALNDTLLHPQHYQCHSNEPLNIFIPPPSVIRYVVNYSNVDEFMEQAHQRMDFLGIKCTMNSDYKNDEYIIKFLDKHSFTSFKNNFINMMDNIRSNIGDVLYRLSDKYELICKYTVRRVVDVKILNVWYPGTIIRPFHDGTLVVAIHTDELDDRGQYQYERIVDVRVGNGNIALCIDDNGDIEIDTNKLLSNWTKEEDDCLRKCYKKHDKIRKQLLPWKYAIWDKMKDDPEYILRWEHRSVGSIQRRARILFGCV